MRGIRQDKLELPIIQDMAQHPSAESRLAGQPIRDYPEQPDKAMAGSAMLHLREHAGEHGLVVPVPPDFFSAPAPHFQPLPRMIEIPP
jgi:hypothetical protein